MATPGVAGSAPPR